MSTQAITRDADRRATAAATERHHGPPPLSDPGKDDRAAHGVPVVPAFDGYRAFAILAIVLFHITHSSGLLDRAGDGLGGHLIWNSAPELVDVLFVVSGFVVFLPTVAQNGEFGSVGGYGIRRGARLLPAYWISLLVVLLVIAVTAHVPMPNLGGLATNFSGQQTWVSLFDPKTAIGFGPDAPVWTLTLEITFYVLLPLVAAAYFRRPLIGLGVALAVSVLWHEAFAHIQSVASWVGADLSDSRAEQLRLSSISQFPAWAFSFAAGMTGAWAYVELRRRHEREALERMAAWVLLAAGAVLALCIYIAAHRAIGTGATLVDVPNLKFRGALLLSTAYTASLATVMVALALARRRLQLPFAHPLARKLGDISYGVYLIHAPLLFYLVFHHVLPTGGTAGAFLAFLAVTLPVALLYGYLSARFLEQPIRRWAHRYGRRAQSVSGPGAGARAQPERARAG